MNGGLTFQIEGGIAILGIDRPAHGNRLDGATAQAIEAACAVIDESDDIRAVCLAGEGPDFCLGQEDPELAHGAIEAVGRLRVPVVAAIVGRAWGEGAELALACDVRLAARDATFAWPQAVEGRLPRHGATQRLPRLIGEGRAVELLLTGRIVSAREALAIGLVSQVVAADKLVQTAAGLIANLSERSSPAMQYAKEATRRSADLSFADGLRLEQDLYVLLQTTRERALAIETFRNAHRRQQRPAKVTPTTKRKRRTS